MGRWWDVFGWYTYLSTCNCASPADMILLIICAFTAAIVTAMMLIMMVVGLIHVASMMRKQRETDKSGTL